MDSQVIGPCQNISVAASIRILHPQMVNGARGRRPNSEWDLGRFRSGDWSDIAAAVQQTSPDLIWRMTLFETTKIQVLAATAPAGAVWHPRAPFCQTVPVTILEW